MTAKVISFPKPERHKPTNPFDNPILRAMDQLQAMQDQRIREMFNG